MLALFLIVCSSATGVPMQNIEPGTSLIDWLDTDDDNTGQYSFSVRKPISLKLVAVRKPRYTRFLDLLSDQLRPEAPKTINIIFKKNPRQPLKKIVPVAMKEYIEIPRPYHVPVLMERKVPVLVERKVPVKVEVPVPKPYPVEVAVPYEVTVVKKVPFVVEKKVPYTVHVAEYVGVPVPVEDHEGKSVHSLGSFEHNLEIEKRDKVEPKTIL